MSRFQGKVALVTGAASGIGEAIAKRLAKDGATVIAADITSEKEGFTKTIGADVSYYQVDVTDEKAVHGLEGWIRLTYGGLDILANNAGIGGPSGLVHEYPIAAFEQIFNVNVRGAFMVLQAGIRLMLESGGGAVVNTASLAGFRGFPNASPYHASKGAMVMLTRTAAIEYATKSIRVNAVGPGLIATPLVQQLDNAEVALQQLTAQIPQGRPGQAPEVANVVAFLADDNEASHVTGQIWCIDGGRSAT
ncbi:hypothetical protein AYO21_02154 [Fonsecaea monophora]|uniref:Uncharacterized protein n=1 Tax=Fonsecaea monophora TaxID=254056 RepID=A0A177FH51_9EURO|nr:hypothetical protein AYO21_02154 [Fonsecaea monophora]KAH0844091.1 putative oxidoreductase [Fonsecaea pedrosoi]OAG43568.1 hypothetical protein AYO21_02154 [Fonsecaea monophora]